MTTIIITGASDGIGAEIAQQLAKQWGPSVNLVLAARRIDKLRDMEAICQAHGAHTLLVPTDVSNKVQCKQLIDETVRCFGGIDTLINNAGISAHAMLDEVRFDDLDWYENLMRINLWGSVWCTHAALPFLKQSRGRVVAVSSLAGLVGVPGRTAYRASKFAMTGFFEALRTEVQAAGVSVTTAYPGVVDTQIRVNGLNAQGRKAGVSGLKEDKAMPVATCAALIIEGMQKRQRDVVMTGQGKLGLWLKLIAPKLLDRMVWAALNK
jgi:short-subunit dehydrogenase